jgi:hypothetical protein
MRQINKKTIGIFGDSYATATLLNIANRSPIIIWPHELDRLFKVVNYGLPGNSVYRCYKDYLEYGSQHDYNIMIIPIRDRFYSSYLHYSDISRVVDFENWYSNYSSLLMYQRALINSDDPNKERHLKIFDSIKTYYELWKDDNFLNVVNGALVDKIKSIDNLLTIEVKPEDPNQLGLMDISNWEIEFIKKQMPEVFENQNEIVNNNGLFLRDNRNCHLTPENNVILGRIIVDAIKTKTKIELKIEDFVPPPPGPKYFEWVSNV